MTAGRAAGGGPVPTSGSDARSAVGAASPTDGLAWVTGASGAWGSAIARELLRSGYDVVALGRSEPSWLATDAAVAGRRWGWVALDLGEPVPAVEELAARTPDGIRSVPDVLVDAAFSTEGDAGALAQADYVAKVALIGGVVDAMRRRGDGRVGVLVGQNGRLGLAGLGDLSAPQGALWTWAEALADELRRDGPGVRLTIVVPPRTASATQRAVAARSGRTAKLRPPDAHPIVRAILAGKRRAGRRPVLAGLSLLVR
jgi:short-subunit dehydrogenase